MDSESDGESVGETSRLLRLELTLSGWTEMPATADSVCHLASFAIRVGTTIRQRCAWCGGHLSAAVTENASEDSIEYPVRNEYTYPVGGFVRKTSEGRGVVGIIWQDVPPSDACFQPARSL